MNHVCVMSAISAIRPERVLFHHDFAPTGPWWPLTAPHVECVKVTAPREIFGRPLHHPAHRADVLRLRILQEHGGIYLDTDVFVHRDFDDLLDYDVVMGREGGAEAPRLCNAVILARAGAPFLERWYAQYRSFRSRGIDEYWIEHSVVLPFKLMQQHPDEITALPHDAFHWPGPTPEEVALLFGPWPGREVRSLYANHLWAQLAVRYTWDLTPGYVRQVDSVFHRWARPFIADLPDDYGKPDLLFRARRRLRHIRRKLAHRFGA